MRMLLLKFNMVLNLLICQFMHQFHAVMNTIINFELRFFFFNIF